jgi:hypothetical protein
VLKRKHHEKISEISRSTLKKQVKHLVQWNRKTNRQTNTQTNECTDTQITVCIGKRTHREMNTQVKLTEK